MLGHGGSPSRDYLGATPAAPSAAAALLDIIVFAGGDSLDLKPLSAFEQKCMLRICNRPMIWYCLAPWVEAGFRTFFLVVNEDYATLHTYLSRAFTGVDFYFVLVPLTINGNTSTTCDGVKAYLSFKEQMRAGTVDGSMAVHDGGGRDEFASSPTGRASAGSGGGATASPTGGVRKAQQPLRAELAALPSFDRDALLLSSDTILAGIDVERFVSSFYGSLASVSAMFFRPHVVEQAPAAPGVPNAHGKGSSGGGKKKGQPQGTAGGAGAAPERKAFTYANTCVAYEEEEESDGLVGGNGAAASRALGGTSMGDGSGRLSSVGQDWGNGTGAGGDYGGGEAAAALQPQHRRLHFMYPLEERPELRITMGFAARRPNLTFAADVVDAHVYLVRRWVLDFIAESAGDPDATVRKHVMPLLARSQHAVVNTAEGVFLTPDKKIGRSIPTHWMYRMRGDLTIGVMNAAKGPLLPSNADNLRVFATIYTESPSVPAKIYRINTRDNYHAVNQELLLAKNSLLRLLDEPATGPHAHQAAVTSGLGAQHKGSVVLRAASAEQGGPPASASPCALASLLPDNPLTLRERLGSQQVYIVGSFIDSAPPPNVFITRSVIGPNVTIATGARITDSVIMANVDIGAKAIISNSVVGTSAVIEAERRVANSVVAPRCYVEEDAVDTIVE